MCKHDYHFKSRMEIRVKYVLSKVLSCSRRSSDTKQSIFTNKDSHGWKCVRLSQLRFSWVSPGVKLPSLALPPQGGAWPANMWFMKSIFIIITLCPSKIWLGRYKIKFIHTFCLPCPIVTVVLLVMAEKVEMIEMILGMLDWKL